MIGMFVSDQDSVNLIDGFFNGRQPGQSFALAESAVDDKAGTLRFEQRDVARTAGRQDGNAQAYRSISKVLPNSGCEIPRREFLR